jgi:opacity protein-like surface antigen
MKSIRICTVLMILGLTQTVIADNDVTDVPISVDVLNAEPINKSETVDVSEVLSATPQTRTSDTSGAYFVLRGGAVMPADADVKYKDSGGSGSAELSYDNAFLFEGALGYAFGNSVRSCLAYITRLELALSYYMYDWDTWKQGGSSFDQSKNSTSFLNVMVNGFWDFDNDSRFTPFLQGGIGFSAAEIDYQNDKSDDTVFAGQLGGGVNFELTPRVLLEATYRYHFSEDFEFKSGGQTIEIENTQHQFLLGAQWRF